MAKNETQIGGDHYGDSLQPIDLIDAGDVPFSEGSIIKYVFRHRRKNGVEDLKKARWFLDRLIKSYEMQK